uniref:B30.2/SPRY domain-containing protein n=1 Tax=Periophthalmus magnuspinnatus TaxID=409849 RepID=A0A3B4ALF0_9GOBI
LHSPFLQVWTKLIFQLLCLSDVCGLGFALDPHTANQKLKLLNLKHVINVEREEPYSEHRDRFDSCPQVLCSSGLTRSCYWEVDWTRRVNIAACYKIISRKEDQGDCFFGENEWSWNMRISDGRYSFRHKGLKSGAEFLCRHTSPKSSQKAEDSGRVGVFLDYEGGFLSFYEVLSNGDRFHLHTFSSSFTQPLFPGFGLWSGSAVSLVEK